MKGNAVPKRQGEGHLTVQPQARNPAVLIVKAVQEDGVKVGGEGCK